MTKNVEFLYQASDVTQSKHVGSPDQSDRIVARSKCPYCEVKSAFRQLHKGFQSEAAGQTVALKCDGCDGIVACNIEKHEIYPTPPVSGLENELPGSIKEYYEEALRCLGANAPNGAATVFRKVINAVCVYYDVTEVEDDESFYDMIERLAEEGIITESLRQSLLGVKDGGADAAHINEQDPTLEQANNIKKMIDSVLTASVVADEKVAEFREEHPNPYTEDEES